MTGEEQGGACRIGGWSCRGVASAVACGLAAIMCVGVPIQVAQAASQAPERSRAAFHQTSTPTWATYNARTKTAHLTVIAAYGEDTYNFNGGARGQFTFTVPLGSRVIVRFTNNSAMMPHGAEIVKYTGSIPDQSPPPSPAFSGAASPNYRHGTPPGTTQTFHFVANKAGKYLLICPVHNHVLHGHWDWFIVSRTATTATGVLKS